MKLRVPYIESIDGEFPPVQVMETSVKYNNWSKDFPYSPSIKIKIWHNNNSLFLHYEVKEEFIGAKTVEDNGKVCKDSCVELFVSFDNKGYYNIESNCIGKILMSHRRGRKIDVEYAPHEILESIRRYPSLGTKPIDCRKESEPWEMTLEIPAKAFFKHDLQGFKGLEGKCNIYKCGDELPLPHFISLFPIETETPDFHRPEFFGDISFE